MNCEACGEVNRDGAKFCSECGRPLTPPPEAALKVVTVVFADVVGSTALQESLEPEAVRRVMSRFYEAVSPVVADHGGRVEKFIGDAVVAVFGVPVVAEDDALRAVRAAWAVGEALEGLNAELEGQWGVRVALRTGVNTGELVIGTEGVLVGDTMNTAARLEQGAGAGEVLVGESTWRLVRHGVDLEEVVPLEAKGKSEPLRAWRVRSPEPAGGEPEAVLGLVGRGAELERLERALDDAGAAGRGRLATVVGSPGLGKTRLAQAFAEAVSSRARLVTGRCEPTGEGITFQPVTEVLRELAGIRDDEAPDVGRDKLAAVLAGAADAERVADRAASLLGAAHPGSPEETFWAVRRCLEEAGRARPLVVMLEDLHWGQPMLLDLVEHLVEWIADSPVLVVALARPELRELRPSLTSLDGHPLDVVELAGLSDAESEALVGGILGPARLGDALWERMLATCEGNPLFLGELVRMLVDEGALVRAGGVWAPARAESSVSMPPTIQALLAARIERLGAGERRVMERAAVIGKQFYPGAVATLTGAPIGPQLGALRHKEMVEPDGTWWIDEEVYRFHHVLIRDAAYRSMLKETRAELHERFADWLEQKAGDGLADQEAVVGFHLEQAHALRRALGPLDAEGRALGARAVIRLHSAGRRALAREDLAAAANLLTRALAAGEAPDPAVLWDLAEAQLSAADVVAAEITVGTLSSAATDEVTTARAQVMQAHLDNVTNVAGAAARAKRLEEAGVVLARAGDPAAEAKAHHVAAQAHALLGQVGPADVALDRAVTAARAVGDQRRVAAVLAAAPRAALWGPSPVLTASGRCLDVLRVLRAGGANRHLEATTLCHQAVLEAMRDRLDAARSMLADGRAILEELGLSFALLETAVFAAQVEVIGGNAPGAVEHLEAARDGFVRLGLEASAAQASALLASALVRVGRDEEAMTASEVADRAGGDDLRTRVVWRSARAQVLAGRGEADAAVALATEAVELVSSTDALSDRADALMALARVLERSGRHSDAGRAATEGLELYRAKGHLAGERSAASLTGQEPVRREASAATAPALGDSPIEDAVAEFARRHAAGDIEGILELLHEDHTLLDHRLSGWEPIQGPGETRTFLESVFANVPGVHLELVEVLACDGRVHAARWTWAVTDPATQAEGRFEVASVYALADDGRQWRTEHFDVADTDAVLARYRELSNAEPMLGDSPVERVVAEFARSYERGDADALADLVTDDYQLVDARAAGWGTHRGRESFRERMQKLWQSTHSVRWDLIGVVACDGRVLAARWALLFKAEDAEASEGRLELGMVHVVEDGRLAHHENLDVDDRDGMLARFRELARPSDVLGHTDVERVARDYAAAFSAHDVEAAVAVYSEDWTMVDHRANGWVANGREGLHELVATGTENSPDIRLDIDEKLGQRGDVLALRLAFRGRASPEFGGGLLEVPVGCIIVAEGGIGVRTEFFEPDDTEAMLSRMEELAGVSTGDGVLGHSAVERRHAAYARAIRDHDLDALARLHAPDWVQVDNRAQGWGELHGPEAAVSLLAEGLKSCPDLHISYDEVLATSDRVLALRFHFRGHALPEDGGGEIAIPVAAVNVYEDGLNLRRELFPYEDTEALMARFAELDAASAGPRSPSRTAR